MARQQPEDLGQRALQILNQRCVTCHTAERFEKVQFTAEEWNRVIDRMVTKGAQLSGDEMDVLRHWKDTE
ncbi:MAG TPA: 3CxxC-type zinc finger protein [Deferrisomatales bacterium]|nr:3CxxC-type zinc finger protein [Deferrisomatales bacterium]